MHKNKIIAIDIDGVLANFHYSFSKVANELFDTPIVENIEDVEAYRWEDWHSLNKYQCNKVWNHIDKYVDDFWLNAKPLVDNSIFRRLKNLELHNIMIYFVTTRQDTAGDPVLHQTIKWIKKMSELEIFSVISTKHKGKIIEGINADFFIDDMPENIIEVAHSLPKCNCFLLVRPYNTFFIDFVLKSHKYRNINIVYSIADFLTIIEHNLGIERNINE